MALSVESPSMGSPTLNSLAGAVAEAATLAPAATVAAQTAQAAAQTAEAEIPSTDSGGTLTEAHVGVGFLAAGVFCMSLAPSVPGQVGSILLGLGTASSAVGTFLLGRGSVAAEGA